MKNTFHSRLRHHVTGAIERGEAQAIVEIPALHKGPFPLHITQNDDHFVIVTNQGNHYAKTFDPSAARLIASAPDLLSALEFLLADYIAINGENLTGSSVPADKAREALRKAKGE
jgi:hypothetical protein